MKIFLIASFLFTLSSCKFFESDSELAGNYQASPYWNAKIDNVVANFPPCTENLSDDLTKRMRFIDPTETRLRFTQDSIDSSFSNGNIIEDTAQELANNPSMGDGFTPIRIFKFNDKTVDPKTLYFSIDNRRLYVFRRARQIQLEKNLKTRPVKVPVALVSKEEIRPHLSKKWTTPKDVVGKSIVLRPPKPAEAATK
jgi:hypothetical protein